MFNYYLCSFIQKTHLSNTNHILYFRAASCLASRRCWRRSPAWRRPSVPSWSSLPPPFTSSSKVRIWRWFQFFGDEDYYSLTWLFWHYCKRQKVSEEAVIITNPSLRSLGRRAAIHAIVKFLWQKTRSGYFSKNVTAVGLSEEGRAKKLNSKGDSTRPAAQKTWAELASPLFFCPVCQKMCSRTTKRQRKAKLRPFTVLRVSFNVGNCVHFLCEQTSEFGFQEGNLFVGF